MVPFQQRTLIPFSPFWLGFLNPILPPSSWPFEVVGAFTVNGGQGHQDPEQQPKKRKKTKNPPFYMGWQRVVEGSLKFQIFLFSLL
ncbi:hypothetical protein ES332_A12G217700v1 [Gossypium tomentosum]|uniref:Uncharacterized protein n=1 Tax=Gossypium tomentosum TaxID=34277 RepID=A0A5D2N2T2_GOSTO|nr:hypothetical protein ES332_A12G217700v1 [Gossypium tomentosum]